MRLLVTNIERESCDDRRFSFEPQLWKSQLWKSQTFIFAIGKGNKGALFFRKDYPLLLANSKVLI